MRAIPILVFTILVGACGGAPARPDRAADSAAIDAIYREAEAAVAAGNVDRYLAILDDSVAILGPGMPAARGRAAVREMLTGMFSSATYAAHLNPPRLIVADSLAVAAYSGTFVSRPRAGGDSVVTRARYVDALRRQPVGGWRLLVHSFQPDAPAP